MENQRFIEIDGEMIAVTEEVYFAFKRPAWREKKRKDRDMRCLDKKGNVCRGNCGQCDKPRASRTISLDGFTDCDDDIAADTDLQKALEDKELLMALFAALDELDPQNRTICRMFGDGCSERDIAAAVGLSQKGVNKRKVKLFADLAKRLEPYR